jgi:hypothetical protein
MPAASARDSTVQGVFTLSCHPLALLNVRQLDFREGHWRTVSGRCAASRIIRTLVRRVDYVALQISMDLLAKSSC